ncbi:MAG: PEP-CTERM sorting domain-containing protein [Verrucomicrobiales bacterium]
MSISHTDFSLRSKHRLFAFVSIFAGMVSSSQALDIMFDYTYDTGGFFGSAGSDQRLALEEAASFFETNFGDDLHAITPGDGNSLSTVFFDPTNSGSNISVNNLSVAADTMVIFVGSEDRGATNLGLAAPGGYNVSAVTTEFLTAVTTRGETGMTSGTADDDTDFGAWGGSVSFNGNAAIDWNFDAFSESAPTEYDFLSTALHEITHVFGFATSKSYERLINVSDEFTGANAVAENGGVVQLTIDGHIDASEMSTVFGTATSQVPIMSDSSGTGSRELMTDLDVAMLEDNGWEVVPERSSALLLFGGGGALLLRRRRRKEEADVA